MYWLPRKLYQQGPGLAMLSLGAGQRFPWWLGGRPHWRDTCMAELGGSQSFPRSRGIRFVVAIGAPGKRERAG